MERDVVTRKIKDLVLHVEKDATVVLFGSRARNSENENSDWDVLVLVNKPSLTFKEEQNIRHQLFDLELEMEEPISTLVYSLHDWNTRMSVTPLFENVKKEGIFL